MYLSKFIELYPHTVSFYHMTFKNKKLRLVFPDYFYCYLLCIFRGYAIYLINTLWLIILHHGLHVSMYKITLMFFALNSNLSYMSIATCVFLLFVFADITVPIALFLTFLCYFVFSVSFVGGTCLAYCV